jgi:glucose/arabinose dehydrogenase
LLSLTTALVGGLAACGDRSVLKPDADVGPNPVLVKPVNSLVPTVNIAPAKGWTSGGAPTAAAGTTVTAFASGLTHPRWLHVLPNGDVLVAETNAPPRPKDGEGIKGWVMGLVMKRAGAAVPSPNRITLLRDADGDGSAEVRHVFMEGLNSPFGMVLVGDKLYVANTDAVVVVPYQPGQTRIDASPAVVTDLPAGPINHHWTKNIIANPDGSRLYATVGSNSNVAENGIEAEQGRAAIWEIDLPSGEKRLYASGLRNPNGMAWGPAGDTLWTVVNERDGLGSDLVPDYLTSVKRDAFYGWPYSYYGKHVDSRVDPPRPDLVAQAVVPDYALGSHVAPLGLSTSQGGKLPAPFADGMFVGMHGSWNREPLSGYKVVFVPFQGASPQGKPIDVLTGFVNADGDALGRPVGVAIDARGALLVADDVGNVIWRVTAAP